MSAGRPDDAAVDRLYRLAKAERWRLPRDRWLATLERSVDRAFATPPDDPREVDRYVNSLHLEDLALACACADGDEAAWDHFVREFRPALYRAADAIDASGGAREVADSIYAELFGLDARDGERRSHLRYYHGRSSLATWLRAVLSQRHVDRVRRERRFDPLPDDDVSGVMATGESSGDPRWLAAVAMIQAAVSSAVTTLAPRDRLRLSCYYAQEMTLTQVGRVLGEHEATVSRHLTRARRAVREEVERILREREGMSEAAIAETFELVVENPGPLDVTMLLGSDVTRKKPAAERST